MLDIINHYLGFEWSKSFNFSVEAMASILTDEYLHNSMNKDLMELEYGSYGG